MFNFIENSTFSVLLEDNMKLTLGMSMDFIWGMFLQLL